MDKNNNTQNESRLPLSRRSLVLMLAAVVLLALGFVLLSGGGLKDPQVFNYDMFNFRRLTLAPIVILAALVMVGCAIFGLADRAGKSGKDKNE